MKQFLLIFVFLQTLSGFNAICGWSQTDLQKQNFQGPVKSVREKTSYVQVEKDSSLSKMGQVSLIEYEFNAAGNIIYWADYYQNELISWYYTVEFDSVKNQKIQLSRMNENYIYSSLIFQYDSEGNELLWYIKDPGDIVLYHWQNEYDKKGYKTGAQSFHGDLDTGRLERYYVYTYKKGKRISEHWYTADGLCLKRTENQYDKKGNLIEVFQYDGTDSLTGKWIQHFDERGQLVEMIYFKSPHAIDSRTIYSYDDFGNQAALKIYNTADSLLATWTYLYTYDSQHNWTAKTQCYNGAAEQMTEREISYFD